MLDPERAGYVAWTFLKRPSKFVSESEKSSEHLRFYKPRNLAKCQPITWTVVDTPFESSRSMCRRVQKMKLLGPRPIKKPRFINKSLVLRLVSII